MIRDLHHVSINVDDLAAAESFYIEILGLERLARPDFGVPGAWLAAGERQVHLIEQAAVPTDIGQHFAFQVDDIAGVIDHLGTEGWECSEIIDVGAGRQVFLHDPAGNRIELNEPVAAATEG